MPKQYPRELRERAVRLVAEHHGEYETGIASSIVPARVSHSRRRNLKQAGDKVKDVFKK